MINIQENVPLAPLTTFKVGGPARYFVEVADEAELAKALWHAREHKLPVFILGGGSNVLFSDAGFNGLVIKVENRNIEQVENRLLADAGAQLMDVVGFACAHGLAGIENLAGIPGSLGGAVRGNAGAFGVEIGGVVTDVTALDCRTSEVKKFSKEECAFAYRDSFFKKNANWLILSAELELKPGNPDALTAAAANIVAQREAKHPQDVRCAGSFFTNPVVADRELREEFERDSGMKCKDDKLPAGWLVDHVGLRGKRVGDAMVSEIHPNYILNAARARAEDIVILASLIKQKVRTELGVQLREEVQMVGF
jgi:UDP-N-acetylmuramate dehydrogenase